MIRPVSPIRPLRPLEALRSSSDQIRQAADVLADIASDTSDLDLSSARMPLPPTEHAAASAATILKAQRSFVARLRLSQIAEDQGTK
jgi:hypothetical protein